MWWVVLGVIAFIVYEEVGAVAKVEQLNSDNWYSRAPWKPQSYKLGAYVTYQGKTWCAYATATSEDVPGVAAKWVEVNPIPKERPQDWTAKMYPAGSYVMYHGEVWKADTQTLSTDRPGGSSHWVQVQW